MTDIYASPDKATELDTLTRKWREWCELRAPTGGCSDVAAIPLDQVPKLLLALVLDEREACATIAHDYAKRWNGYLKVTQPDSENSRPFSARRAAAQDIGDAIRDRSK